MRAISIVADQWGCQIASEASLKVQLHRWEHGQARPNQRYQALLCAIFRTSPEQLGFNGRPTCSVHEDLLARIDVLEDQVRRLAGLLAAA
ncbi:hypothetical protein OH805_26030 [Streptomyces sp. NBC_00879]|uniref:hypothetical protein n=1 Tax=Streptomyces sp. NBC_00879 TaxID=2975855 RepID=UPI00386F364A|nr:hypothetical protein OH805_26030 [Streptomyces sp. NBC_00879]